MLENIRGHSRGSIPPLRMPSLLPHDLCHEWNVSRWLPAPEKSHGQRNLVGYSSWGCKDSDKGLSDWAHIHWKDWCLSWSWMLWPPDMKSWLTGKDPDAGKDWGQEEKGVTGWDGWMASPTQWTWVWANSGSWWRTGKPGMLQSLKSQKVGHDWTTEQQHVMALSGWIRMTFIINMDSLFGVFTNLPKESERKWSHLVMSDSLRPHGL